MREILFRGKRIDNDKWVEGCLIFNKEKSYAAIGDECETTVITPFDTVFPETIGQYTGLTDKNGKQIFEGDIVKGEDRLAKGIEVCGYIDHKNGSFVIVGDFMTHYRWLDYDVEVIGNIHDNPELLKGGIEE